MRERINTLLVAGMINEETANYLNSTVSALGEKGFDIESDDMARTITHMAMAISRQLKGESVAPMEDFLFDEVKKDTSFESGTGLWEGMQGNIPVKFNEDEEKFMMLHLCTLINNKK